MVYRITIKAKNPNVLNRSNSVSCIPDFHSYKYFTGYTKTKIMLTFVSIVQKLPRCMESYSRKTEYFTKIILELRQAANETENADYNLEQNQKN